MIVGTKGLPGLSAPKSDEHEESSYSRRSKSVEMILWKLEKFSLAVDELVQAHTEYRANALSYLHKYSLL